MQVRKYQAQNMKEALKLVRRDLGSQAIILSTRTIDSGIAGKTSVGRQRGVEVVAAIDYDFGPSAMDANSFSQSRGSGVSPWKDLLSDKVSLENIRHELKELKKIVRQSSSSDENEGNDFISAELKELKWIAQFLLRQAAALNHHNFPEHLVHFHCQMIKQGVCEEIVLKFIKELKQDLSPDALGDRDRVRDTLISRIGKELLLAGPIDLSPGKTKIAALVGPTGVGKTTTVAKLAALFALDEKRKVALVTIDTYRIAAVEQLKAYAKIMGLPFKTVSSPEEFSQVLTQLADRDLILVDTAGRSQRDQFQIKELKSFLRQSFPVEIYLVMSITHNEDNLSAIGNQFGLLPIDRIIFSKLDESYTYGRMVNQLIRIKKPLSYITTGQKVPEDIEIATKERIVSLIMDKTDIQYC
jgi:flagellar biosynthesis protein FlhF